MKGSSRLNASSRDQIRTSRPQRSSPRGAQQAVAQHTRRRYGKSRCELATIMGDTNVESKKDNGRRKEENHRLERNRWRMTSWTKNSPSSYRRGRSDREESVPWSIGRGGFHGHQSRRSPALTGNKSESAYLRDCGFICPRVIIKKRSARSAIDCGCVRFSAQYRCLSGGHFLSKNHPLIASFRPPFVLTGVQDVHN